MTQHGIRFHPYQTEARDAATYDLFVKGSKSTLIVMPTGTGKTMVAGMICLEIKAAFHKPVLFLAHREILVDQAYNCLVNLGLDTTVEMADRSALEDANFLGLPDVVVGSVQTLCRFDRLNLWPKGYFKLIIIDESHRALAPSYTKIINHFHSAKVIGLTATPQRGDSKNLGARFETKCYQLTMAEAISGGWIVPVRHLTCPVSVDLRGLTTRANGDFLDSELAERIGQDIEGLARSFKKEVGDRPAVAFLPDTTSCQAFSETLERIGMSSRFVVGTSGKVSMSKKERKENQKDYEDGKFQTIVSCDVLNEGWDAPPCSAVGILRPTNQWYRFCQMVGRGTRVHAPSGKKDCLIVDYDWRTDAEIKDLRTIIDIFDDGSLDQEVIEEAKKISQKPEENREPQDIIKEASEIVATRRKFMIGLTGRELQYTAYEQNPFEVSRILDIPLNKKYDIDYGGINPASDKQKDYLRSLGVAYPDKLSKWGASKLIDQLLRRKRLQLANANQVSQLLNSGVLPEMARSMTSTQARNAINKLNKVS